MNIPTLREILSAAPLATIVLTIAAVGFYAAHIIYKEHIKTLKEFIEYLKGKK